VLLFSLHNYRIVSSLGLDKLSLRAFGVVVDTKAGPNCWTVMLVAGSTGGSRMDNGR